MPLAIRGLGRSTRALQHCSARNRQQTNARSEDRSESKGGKRGDERR